MRLDEKQQLIGQYAERELQRINLVNANHAEHFQQLLKSVFVGSLSPNGISRVYLDSVKVTGGTHRIRISWHGAQIDIYAESEPSWIDASEYPESLIQNIDLPAQRFSGYFQTRLIGEILVFSSGTVLTFGCFGEDVETKETETAKHEHVALAEAADRFYVWAVENLRPMSSRPSEIKP
jgi:hypothetical protein